ncbi:MAG: DMT family transporter, partial [Lachnospiraceae bacterium]|nr:DMT family transporter [Lachnospiraceae bacterium]
MRKREKNRKTKYALMLAATSFIWGSAFIAQDIGSDYMKAFTFNGLRFLIGAAFLVPVIIIFKKLYPTETKGSRKDLMMGGIISGILLCLATNLQQIGIGLGTTAGKASFLTSMYIILVPL